MSDSLLMLATGLSVACFFSFAWAVRSLFRTPEGGLPRKMKLLSALGLLFFFGQLAALLFPSSDAVLWLRVVGMAFFALSIALFWWAVRYARKADLKIAFSESKPIAVLAEGPYRIIRHPFYASYIAFWLAGTFVSQRWLLVVSVIVMGWLYLDAIAQEEAEFLAGARADDYRKYRGSTGSLVPRLPFRFGRMGPNS